MIITAASSLRPDYWGNEQKWPLPIFTIRTSASICAANTHVDLQGDGRNPNTLSKGNEWFLA